MTSNEPGADAPDIGLAVQAPDDRVVYVMPEETLRAYADDGRSLLELWWILWRSEFLITGVTALFAIRSIVNALVATEWCRAEVLMVLAEERSSQSLAGAFCDFARIAMKINSVGSAEGRYSYYNSPHRLSGISAGFARPMGAGRVYIGVGFGRH